MNTHFLPAERADAITLNRQLAKLTQHELLDQIMEAAGGALAVVNEQRQLVGWNTKYLDAVGAPTPEALLGLRVGESFRCINAELGPGGCGTALRCRNCGAALALAATLKSGKASQEVCVMECGPSNGGKSTTRYFNVHSRELHIDGERYLLLLLLDCTTEQNLAQFHRVFLHDLSNLLVGMVGNADLLALQPGLAHNPSLMALKDVSHRMAREVMLQSAVSHADLEHYRPSLETVSITALLEEFEALWREHPLARDKDLSFTWSLRTTTITTDPFILHRTLGNMMSNALEAIPKGQGVEFRASEPEYADGRMIRFEVTNPGQIPEMHQSRIFQRYFTTKGGTGRGLGTWSIRVLIEELLGGNVGFESASGQTVFWAEVAV